MVAALPFVLAYLLWVGLGLCLPPYIAGRYPASLLGQVYNENSDCVTPRTCADKGGCDHYTYRWMFAASAVFPPALAFFVAMGAVALVCVCLYALGIAIGSVPQKLMVLGEKHRTEKLLPKASVRSLTSESDSSGQLKG